MSNLIKGYSVRYAEDFKALDLNARAEQIENEYMEEAARKLAEPKDFAFKSFAEGIADGSIEQVGVTGEQDEGALLLNTEFTDPEEGEAAGYAAPSVSDELDSKINAQREELERLREQADIILSDAKEEVKRLLMEANEEAEAIKARAEGEAKSVGYAEGIEQAENEYRDRLQKLREKEDSIDADYEQKIKELEPAFLDLTLKLVRKLTGIYAEERSEIILYLMEETLIDHNKDRDFIIRVSPEDVSVVKEQIGGIKVKLPKDTTIEIVEDKLLGNKDCLIETGTRVFDCSLRMQMNELLEDVRLLGGAMDES